MQKLNWLNCKHCFFACVIRYHKYNCSDVGECSDKYNFGGDARPNDQLLDEFFFFPPPKRIVTSVDTRCTCIIIHLSIYRHSISAVHYNHFFWAKNFFLLFPFEHLFFCFRFGLLWRYLGVNYWLKCVLWSFNKLYSTAAPTLPDKQHIFKRYYY